MDGEDRPFRDGALPFVDRRLGPLPDDEMDDDIDICRRWLLLEPDGIGGKADVGGGAAGGGRDGLV